MIPFNKIPRGLRVPLFFGELAIDGDVLGGSPQPPQPGISCVGASEKMNFGSFRGYWDMELNGVFYPSSTDLLQNYITNHFSDKIYADYDGFINFGNISHDDHRIRLIPIMDAGYSNPYGNDTFMENEDGSLTFCLKGVVEKPVISCDGATANLPLSITLPMRAADGTFTIRDASKTANNELDVIVEIFGSDIVEGQDFVTQLNALVNPDYASLVSFTTLNPTVFAEDGTVTGYINIKANVPDLRISVELIKAIDVNPDLLFLNILTPTNPSTPTYFWDTHDPENGNYFLSACISDSNQISCAGATQSILFEPGPAFNGQINWAVEFDGVAYDIGNVWAGEIISNMPSHIKDMIFMEWTGLWLVENRDTQPHRFKLIPSPKPGYDPIQAPSSTNESFLLNEDGSFAFCLASKDTLPIISCEGASPNLRFERFVGRWDMEVDGVFYKSSIDDMLQNWITANLSHIMFANYDGFMIFGNVTSDDHRIRFIPTNPDAQWLDPSENDTFMQHPDGTLTVCLKAVIEEVSCNPTSLSLKNTTLGIGGTASLQYRVNAPNFNIDEVQTFERVDNASDIEMEELLGYWMDHIMGLYDFIHIVRTHILGSASEGNANFYLQSVGSPVATSMNLIGFSDSVRSEPISITFIRSGLQGDIFGQLFDGLDNEKVTHSCGVSEQG